MISPTLFNISLSDMEMEIGKEQEGGAVLGKKKMIFIAYADDVAIMSMTPEGFKEMIKRLGKYLEKKGLELNTEKPKGWSAERERGQGNVLAGRK